MRNFTVKIDNNGTYESFDADRFEVEEHGHLHLVRLDNPESDDYEIGSEEYETVAFFSRGSWQSLYQNFPKGEEK